MTPELMRRDRRPAAYWPHAWLSDPGPDLAALAGLWFAWWIHRQAGNEHQAAAVLHSIESRPIDPSHLLILWRSADQADEPELRDMIQATLARGALAEEYEAAAEHGRKFRSVVTPGPRRTAP
jgi:hypothetical protein